MTNVFRLRHPGRSPEELASMRRHPAHRANFEDVLRAWLDAEKNAPGVVDLMKVQAPSLYWSLARWSNSQNH